MTTFTVVDVETANHSRASVCQIGIVQVRDGRICGEWQSLVDPEGAFHTFHTGLHGIDVNAVSGAPVFPDLYGKLKRLFGRSVAVGHSQFDRQALDRTTDRYNLPMFPVAWLDSVVIARDAWPGLPSYKLGPLAEMLSIDFRHHDALEDARAAAKVVLLACAVTGRSIESWL